MINKRFGIIACATVLFILCVVGITLLMTKNQKDHPTGGSGTPKNGTLILTGYETTSNDNTKVPVGEFFSTTQQRKIRSFLESLLYSKSPLPEYDGAIVPGSVDVDYRKSVVQFKVRVKNPSLTYTVQYNTITDELNVVDEKGEVRTAPSE